MREEYNERLRGNDLELYLHLRQRVVTTRYNFVCVCVCLSLLLSIQWQLCQHTTCITLGAIYKCSLIRRTKTYLQIFPSPSSQRIRSDSGSVWSGTYSSHPVGLVSQQTPPSLQNGVLCQPELFSTCVQLLHWKHLGQHARSILFGVDICHSKILFFYLLNEPMISPLDVLGPQMVSCVLLKVDSQLFSCCLLQPP